MSSIGKFIEMKNRFGLPGAEGKEISGKEKSDYKCKFHYGMIVTALEGQSSG